MRDNFTSDCLTHFSTLVVGAVVIALAPVTAPAAVAGGVAATGLAATIGAGQLVAGGMAGLGAMAVGRLIQGRIKEDQEARAVFEAVEKQIQNAWLKASGEHGEAAKTVAEVFNEGLGQLEFPISDCRKVAENAGRGDGLYSALAQALLTQLPDPFGQLRQEPHRSIALDCLREAVRAGILANETLRQETILSVADTAVQVSRETLEAVRANTVVVEGVLEKIDRLIAMHKRNASEPAPQIEPTVIVSLARRIVPEVEDFDQAFAELERAVQIALEVQEDGRRGHNAGTIVDAVLARVAELSGRGQLDEATEVADSAYKDWRRREAERTEIAKQEGLAFIESNIKLCILQRDAVLTAHYLFEKEDLSSTHRPLHFENLLHLQNDWYIRGRDKGLNFDLEVSISVARLLLARANGVTHQGAIQNNLGNALATLGERETGTARLQQAVTAYRAALLLCPRDKVPFDWAAAQNNLGNVLLSIGGRETGSVRLEQAVTAYENALSEYTREKVPLDWAMTQNNLGSVLSTLGERENGTTRFEQAVTAYENALLEYTREKVPLEWATTQSNLGSVLSSFGERESGTVRLEQAVIAYENALLGCTREIAPLNWAQIHSNLANVLTALGQREKGTMRLEQAVTACENALLVEIRGKVPLKWAATQCNLGNALYNIGVRGVGTVQLQQAVTAYENALLESTREKVPLIWAALQNNLGTTLRSVGEREGETSWFEQAVNAHEKALLEYTRDRVPLDWAMAQNNLGNALRSIGARESGTTRLVRAVVAYENALLVRTRGKVPLNWADSTGSKADAQRLIAERTGNRAIACAAVDDLHDVVILLEEAGHEGWLPFYRWALGEANRVVELVCGG